MKLKIQTNGSFWKEMNENKTKKKLVVNKPLEINCDWESQVPG
jgi:hypothetical protein